MNASSGYQTRNAPTGGRVGLSVQELKQMTAMRMAQGGGDPSKQRAPTNVTNGRMSAMDPSAYQTATPAQLQAAGIIPPVVVGLGAGGIGGPAGTGGAGGMGGGVPGGGLSRHVSQPNLNGPGPAGGRGIGGGMGLGAASGVSSRPLNSLNPLGNDPLGSIPGPGLSAYHQQLLVSSNPTAQQVRSVQELKERTKLRIMQEGGTANLFGSTGNGVGAPLVPGPLVGAAKKVVLQSYAQAQRMTPSSSTPTLGALTTGAGVHGMNMPLRQRSIDAVSSPSSSMAGANMGIGTSIDSYDSNSNSIPVGAAPLSQRQQQLLLETQRQRYLADQRGRMQQPSIGGGTSIGGGGGSIDNSDNVSVGSMGSMGSGHHHSHHNYSQHHLSHQQQSHVNGAGTGRIAPVRRSSMMARANNTHAPHPLSISVSSIPSADQSQFHYQQQQQQQQQQQHVNSYAPAAAGHRAQNHQNHHHHHNNHQSSHSLTHSQGLGAHGRSLGMADNDLLSSLTTTGTSNLGAAPAPARRVSHFTTPAHAHAPGGGALDGLTSGGISSRQSFSNELQTDYALNGILESFSESQSQRGGGALRAVAPSPSGDNHNNQHHHHTVGIHRGNGSSFDEIDESGSGFGVTSSGTSGVSSSSISPLRGGGRRPPQNLFGSFSISSGDNTPVDNNSTLRGTAGTHQHHPLGRGGGAPSLNRNVRAGNSMAVAAAAAVAAVEGYDSSSPTAANSHHNNSHYHQQHQQQQDPLLQREREQQQALGASILSSSRNRSLDVGDSRLLRIVGSNGSTAVAAAAASPTSIHNSSRQQLLQHQQSSGNFSMNMSGHSGGSMSLSSTGNTTTQTSVASPPTPSQAGLGMGIVSSYHQQHHHRHDSSSLFSPSATSAAATSGFGHSSSFDGVGFGAGGGGGGSSGSPATSTNVSPNTSSKLGKSASVSNIPRGSPLHLDEGVRGHDFDHQRTSTLFGPPSPSNALAFRAVEHRPILQHGQPHQRSHSMLPTINTTSSVSPRRTTIDRRSPADEDDFGAVDYNPFDLASVGRGSSIASMAASVGSNLSECSPNYASSPYRSTRVSFNACGIEGEGGGGKGAGGGAGVGFDDDDGSDIGTCVGTVLTDDSNLRHHRENSHHHGESRLSDGVTANSPNAGNPGNVVAANRTSGERNAQGRVIRGGRRASVGNLANSAALLSLQQADDDGDRGDESSDAGGSTTAIFGSSSGATTTPLSGAAIAAHDANNDTAALTPRHSQAQSQSQQFPVLRGNSQCSQQQQGISSHGRNSGSNSNTSSSGGTAVEGRGGSGRGGGSGGSRRSRNADTSSSSTNSESRARQLQREHEMGVGVGEETEKRETDSPTAGRIFNPFTALSPLRRGRRSAEMDAEQQQQQQQQTQQQGSGSSTLGLSITGVGRSPTAAATCSSPIGSSHHSPLAPIITSPTHLHHHQQQQQQNNVHTRAMGSGGSNTSSLGSSLPPTSPMGSGRASSRGTASSASTRRESRGSDTTTTTLNMPSIVSTPSPLKPAGGGGGSSTPGSRGIPPLGSTGGGRMGAGIAGSSDSLQPLGRPQMQAPPGLTLAPVNTAALSNSPRGMNAVKSPAGGENSLSSPPVRSPLIPIPSSSLSPIAGSMGISMSMNGLHGGHSNALALPAPLDHAVSNGSMMTGSSASFRSSKYDWLVDNDDDDDEVSPDGGDGGTIVAPSAVGGGYDDRSVGSQPSIGGARSYVGDKESNEY